MRGDSLIGAYFRRPVRAGDEDLWRSPGDVKARLCATAVCFPKNSNRTRLWWRQPPTTAHTCTPADCCRWFCSASLFPYLKHWIPHQCSTLTGSDLVGVAPVCQATPAAQGEGAELLCTGFLGLLQRGNLTTDYRLTNLVASFTSLFMKWSTGIGIMGLLERSKLETDYFLNFFLSQVINYKSFFLLQLKKKEVTVGQCFGVQKLQF